MKTDLESLLLPFRDELVFVEDSDEPIILTEAIKAGSLLAKRSEQGTYEATKTITIRMGFDSFRFIEVAASRVKNTSRNEIINQLLRAGMQAAWEKMSEAEQQDFLTALKNSFKQEN